MGHARIASLFLLILAVLTSSPVFAQLHVSKSGEGWVYNPATTHHYKLTDPMTWTEGDTPTMSATVSI